MKKETKKLRRLCAVFMAVLLTVTSLPTSDITVKAEEAQTTTQEETTTAAEEMTAQAEELESSEENPSTEEAAIETTIAETSAEPEETTSEESTDAEEETQTTEETEAAQEETTQAEELESSEENPSTEEAAIETTIAETSAEPEETTSEESTAVEEETRTAEETEAEETEAAQEKTTQADTTEIAEESSEEIMPMAESARATTQEGLTYSVNNGEVTITGCDKNVTEVVIPETIEGYPVTSIGEDAFDDCSGLTSIEIPSTVTSISGYVLSGYSNLESVIFNGESIEVEGWRLSFSGCKNLQTLKLPVKVTGVEDISFFDCYKLTQVEIPYGITSISGGNAVYSYGTFANCVALTSVVLPDSVTSIEDYAFKWCDSLESIVIPDSVTSIGEGAFYSCDKLVNVRIPASMTTIKKQTFYGCSKLEDIEIPAGVTSIEDWAFFGCTELSGIRVAEGNTVYDSRDNCNAIIETANNTLLFGCKGTKIPLSVTTIAENAFHGSGLTEIEIPASVVSIGDKAFYGCSELGSIRVAERNTVYDSRGNCNAIIKTADNELVVGCKNSIIPSDVVSIGDSAFADCKGLTSIKIPYGVESIANRAFYGCSGLTELVIPSTVINLDSYAFRNCGGLKCITNNSSDSLYLADVVYNSEWCTEDGKHVTSVYSGKTVLRQGEQGAVSGSTQGLIYWNDGSEVVIRSTELTIDSEIVIPETINGCPVKRIATGAFANCRNLTSIQIPSGVTDVGEQVFYGCDNLVKIVNNSSASITGLPGGLSGTGWHLEGTDTVVTSVEAGQTVVRELNGSDNTSGGNLTDVFVYFVENEKVVITGCDKNATEAVIPEKIEGYPVTYIGVGAFKDCKSLTRIEIPSGVTSIGKSAFKDCSSLISLEIPSGVTSIGEMAFENCKSLTRVEIPSGVTSIGWIAFKGCSGLTSIKVEEGNTVYDSRENCNAIIETESNKLIVGCQTTQIPDSVTDIWGWAFFGCSGLTSIEIPSGVTSIWDSAFYGCSGLTSIEIPSGVRWIMNSAFYGCSGLTSIEIPSGVTSIGERAFYGCSGLMSIEIPSGVTSIGNYAFSGCSGLTSIEIPSGVTSIGNYAFYWCSGLTSIEIPSGVTSIGNYAFRQCSGLTSIKVEEGNTVYDSRENCNAIIETESNKLITGCQTTKIPDNVTSIGDEAFFNCSGLINIEIPSGVTSIGDRAFYGCSGLTSIKVEEGNTVYDSRENCNAIIETESNKLITGCQTTKIPDNVTSIGDGAFFNCSGLINIEIPSGVTSIGDSAFYGCSGLTSIKVEEGNTVYDSRENCNAIIETESNKLITGCQTTKIPDSVTSIGDRAFSYCGGLTSIEIPSEVTSIGDRAFSYCSGLTSIQISSGVANIGRYIFVGCDNLVKIVNNSSATIADLPGTGWHLEGTDTVVTSVEAGRTVVRELNSSDDTPSENPTDTPSENPTDAPSENPTDAPSENPTDTPSESPTVDSVDIINNATLDFVAGAGTSGIKLEENVFVGDILSLDANEQERIANGETLKVSFVVERIDDKVTDEEKALIGEKLEGGVVGMYLDLSVLKQIGHSEATEVGQLDKPVTVVIDVPQELINTDEKVDRTYAIIRIHDGAAEWLDATYSDGKVTFQTDRFSTYALVYKDTVKNTEPPTSPSTGVGTTMIYATIAMIAGLSYILLYFSGRRHGMSAETKAAIVSSLIQWAKKGGRLRVLLAKAAIIMLLAYYHSIGKKVEVDWEIGY